MSELRQLGVGLKESDSRTFTRSTCAIYLSILMIAFNSEDAIDTLQAAIAPKLNTASFAMPSVSL